MKNSDQAEQGYMRLAEDTLEGMSEEELQEALSPNPACIVLDSVSVEPSFLGCE